MERVVDELAELREILTSTVPSKQYVLHGKKVDSPSACAGMKRATGGFFVPFQIRKSGISIMWHKTTVSSY
jgi:hypothetical protein